MPWCEVVTFPDGTQAFVRYSGKRPRAKPCAVCQAPATIQCDHPQLHGGTCDKFLRSRGLCIDSIPALLTAAAACERERS
jgi:hypothetical protein